MLSEKPKVSVLFCHETLFVTRLCWWYLLPFYALSLGWLISSVFLISYSGNYAKFCVGIAIVMLSDIVLLPGRYLLSCWCPIQRQEHIVDELTFQCILISSFFKVATFCLTLGAFVWNILIVFKNLQTCQPEIALNLVFECCFVWWHLLVYCTTKHINIPRSGFY